MATIESYELKPKARADGAGMKKPEVRWRVRYRTPGGRSTDKSGFLTKAQAALWSSATLMEKHEGRYISASDKKTKLGPFIERHINRTVRLSETTTANRKSIGKKWVIPEWAEWQVGSVTRVAVEDWVQRLDGERVSPSVIEKAHGILLAALDGAVQGGLIPANPASKISLPKHALGEDTFLTHDQVVELATAIDRRSRTLIGILAYSGLRFGEAAALRVGSVDLAARKIAVTRSVTSVDGRLVEGPPKGGRRREVYFPDFLDGGIAEQTLGKRRADLLFTAPRGGAVRLDVWRERTFYKATALIDLAREKAAGESQTVFEPFPALTPHDLRHTAASLAVSAGANVKALQRMLGHASASMTLDRYAGLFDDDLVGVSIALSTQASKQVDVSVWAPTPPV